MEVMGGGKEIPLNAVKPCGMGVPPNEVLNMNKTPYLIIDYLLRIECRDLKSQVGWLR